MTQSAPDIVLIVLDTQRADRLGCYGNPRPLSPNLDRFAADGAIFRRAVSPAQWTIPSHASLFSGLYPTAHQVTQSNHRLAAEIPHLAEILAAAGYETVGFCNNPLVGVLDNGLRRGFDTFYNYGGAAPLVWQPEQESWQPLRRIGRFFQDRFRRFAIAVQNHFGHSERALRFSLNSWLTPIWARFANFKGQNERSVRHIRHFLQQRDGKSAERPPLFLFINLMETHLPFWPPQSWIDQVAPWLRDDPAARADMRRWNREAYRWAAPLEAPLPEREARLLSDLYDAEVAYQDSYLGGLLTQLQQRPGSANTLTIIVSDHGDGLGEHNFVGHAFVAYDELVHVPLILHWPEQIAPGSSVPDAVSTRRVFHTIAEAAGGPSADSLSLLRTLTGPDPEQGHAFAEIWPPANFVSALAHRQPWLLARYRCDALRRAVVRDNFKLIQVAGNAEEVYDLHLDAAETDNRINQPALQPLQLALNARLDAFTKSAEAAQGDPADTFALHDEQLLAHLRGLGYIE
jgi:uncharacterized sulfatase